MSQSREAEGGDWETSVCPQVKNTPCILLLLSLLLNFLRFFIFLGLWQFKLGMFMPGILWRIYEDLAKAFTLWVITQHWWQGLQRVWGTSLRCSSCRCSFCEDGQCKTPDPAPLQWHVWAGGVKSCDQISPPQQCLLSLQQPQRLPPKRLPLSLSHFPVASLSSFLSESG